MTFEFYLLNTSGSGSRYFYFSPARLSRDRTRKVWRKKIPQPSGEDDFLSANPARGLTLTGYTGHGTTFAGWEIKYTVVCFAWSVAILFLICSPLPDKDVFFYTDLTNPYAGYVLNLQKLKAYNRLMFPLAMALNREL